MSQQSDNKSIAASEQTEMVVPIDAAPVVLADVMRQMGMAGRAVQLRDMDGKTIQIFRAKRFLSSYEGQKRDPYFVLATTEDGEIIQTVVGGEACVEVLDAYIRTNPTAPLQVTVRWNEGGNYSGYYTFE